MSDKKRCEPAFPQFPVEPYTDPKEPDTLIIPLRFMGMTLRDYFAAQALVALIPSALERERETPDMHKTRDLCAFDAYRWADAMLAEREEMR